MKENFYNFRQFFEISISLWKLWGGLSNSIRIIDKGRMVIIPTDEVFHLFFSSTCDLEARSASGCNPCVFGT